MWEYFVYFQAQSTGEDSNSMSENEEDMSNHGSILNAVKTEPSDILNDSIEHHRNSFPAALLSLQGNYLAFIFGFLHSYIKSCKIFYIWQIIVLFCLCN